MVLTNELKDAARNGDTAAIQEWFSTGTRDPDEKDEFGRPPLSNAASGGHIETMRLILAHGARVDASDRYGCTPFYHAAFYERQTAAVMLLDHGAQVDARSDGGRTPLFHAVKGHCCEMIRLLLHHGADIDARESNGKSAEAKARRHPKSEAEALLKEIRFAGGWRGYVRYPRFRLLMLRIVAEQGRAETQDPLLRRLFPAGRQRRRVLKQPREAYRAQKGGCLPRGIFAHIIGYWRSSRDYRAPGEFA